MPETIRQVPNWLDIGADFAAKAGDWVLGACKSVASSSSSQHAFTPEQTKIHKIAFEGAFRPFATQVDSRFLLVEERVRAFESSGVAAAPLSTSDPSVSLPLPWQRRVAKKGNIGWDTPARELGPRAKTTLMAAGVPDDAYTTVAATRDRSSMVEQAL